MENVVINKPATLPATSAKLFKALDVPAFINGVLQYNDTERCTPSLIKMNKGAAIAALGGKTTAPAFITGLLYALSAHAYGQARLADMVKLLPVWAAHCLTQGAEILPGGKGATVGQIKGATAHAIAAMLTLPARVPAVKVNGPVKVIDAPANDAPAGYMAQDAMLCNPPMDCDEQGTRYAAWHARNVAANAVVRAKSATWFDDNEKASKREWIAEQAAIKAADVMIDRAIAIAEFQKLAEFLHVKLSAAQIKALAA